MALLALHFSKIYKDKLLKKGKRSTMVNYPLYLVPGQKLPVYISNKNEEEKSTSAKKIGTATIAKIFVIKTRDINDENAKIMRHKSRLDVINSLKRWYKINNNSIITYLEFELR